MAGPPPRDEQRRPSSAGTPSRGFASLFDLLNILAPFTPISASVEVFRYHARRHVRGCPASEPVESTCGACGATVALSCSACGIVLFTTSGSTGLTCRHVADAPLVPLMSDGGSR
jgi:hypothetical protein